MQEIAELLAVAGIFLINALWILGVHLLFDWSSPFGFLSQRLYNRVHTQGQQGVKLEAKHKMFPVWLQKPLYLCPFCMASVHGSAFYFIADLGPVQYWPVYCVALCGLVMVIWWGRDE